MIWSKEHTRRLLELHSKDKYFWSEIAELLDVKPSLLRHHVRELGLKHGPKVNARKGEWNIQHKALREPVMKYFVTHSMQETMDRFGLTRSQFKSIFTIGYRDPALAGYRKDRRRRDSWSKRELKFLLRHSGLKSRAWIAARLDRGTLQSTKECLSRLRMGSKHINGLPERLANLIVPVSGLKTEAGAPGPAGNCHMRLVPWVAMDEVVKKRKDIRADYRESVAAMARFQRWVFSSQSNQEVLRKIKGIINEE